MANAVAIDGRIFKNSTGQLMARVVGDANAAVAQADIASIVYSVYTLDPDDPDDQEVIDGHEDVALTVADVVFDSLQTDSRWTVDSTGYNFRFEIDVSSDEAFPVRGDVYLVRAELKPTSGQVIVVEWKIKCV